MRPFLLILLIILTSCGEEQTIRSLFPPAPLPPEGAISEPKGPTAEEVIQSIVGETPRNVGFTAEEELNRVSRVAPRQGAGVPPTDPQNQCDPVVSQERRGANFVCWYAGCFTEGEVTNSLDAFQELGGNWLAIVPTVYQADLSSSIIYVDLSDTPTEEEIRNLISLAHGRGLQVLLKPHVDVETGEWRGEIVPDDLVTWQASYREQILNYAQIASETGVEIFSIGTELETQSGDTTYWRGLIAEIRAIYPGQLTYSANWTEYDSVAFWGELDFIGIDFYFPLTDDSEATVDEMIGGLLSSEFTIQEYAAGQNRPVLFTEFGFRSVDGANTRPYDFTMDGEVDLQEQADAYEAVLSVFGDDPWLEGMFLWRWDPQLSGASDDDNYLIYGKPAAGILSNYWEGMICDEGGGPSAGGGISEGEAVSFVMFGDWGDRGGDNQRGVAQAIADYCELNLCDFLITLGDNFYSSGVESVTDSHWFESYVNVYRDGPEGVGLMLPFYPSLGNHDHGYEESAQAQVDYSQIDPLWRMPATQYSFCWGTGTNSCLVEIFIIDSQWPGFDSSESQQQLREDACSSPAPWKFVAMHHPIISNGNHGNWDQGSDGLEALTDIVADCQIDVVLSGHDHSFAHLTDTVNGTFIDQLVVGTGGRGLRDVDSDDPRVLSSGSFFGFGWMQATADRATFRMIQTDGSVFYETSWSTP